MTEYEVYSSSDAVESGSTEVESLVEQVESIKAAEQVQVVLLLAILIWLVLKAIHSYLCRFF